MAAGKSSRINRPARGRYEALEFEPSPTDPYHLFLLMKDLRVMLSE